MHLAQQALEPAQSGFTVIDWLIVGGYLLVVILVGVMATRRRANDDDFFLAGRNIPMWAAAVSVLATSLSAATFIGGPQQSYEANLTYLSANLGGLLAILIVAFFFLPAFYRHGVTSIYELLGHAYGAPARTCASAMFMIGRVFASGARLFIVALPFSLIVFGDVEARHLSLSIVIIAAVATLYTMFGGIRAVIWTDVLQALIFVVAVTIAGALLLSRIPIPAGEIIDVLRNTKVGDQSRLVAIDAAWGLDKWYTIWTALIGWTLFNLAAFGTDQDLVQRMLTCRSAKAASGSAILSNIIGWPVVALFLGLGLLLHIFYDRPDLMGEASPAYAIDDSRTVFLRFILHEIGPGLRGLMVAGLFAAAMSSLDSALNAMASTAVADFYRPWRVRRGLSESDGNERLLSRAMVLVWAVILAAFAIICVHWQAQSGLTLINFALGVMMFAYSGLLAVFLTALFTRRGNAASAIAALAAGFATILILRQGWLDPILEDVLERAELETTSAIAMPWQMVIATGLSTIVCCLGERELKAPKPNDSATASSAP